MKHLLKHFKELTVRPKNAQELKGLILQLAIQGKLTRIWREENPDVESASELLKTINKNKESLIRSKKVRKETAKKEFLKDAVNHQIPKTWQSRNITEFYYTIGGKTNQIQSKNYSDKGKFPIVSQGKNEIDGYSDDESKLLKITKPVIVFGDHTRNVKYIDYNFIIGADGTKILNPYDGIDSKYFYLHTSYFDLSNKGYARHYNLLKLEAFCLPPLEEQKEIVKVVETLFKEVDQLEQLTVDRITLKEHFVTSALNLLTTNNAKKEWEFLKNHFKSFFNETTNIKKLRETILQLAVQGKLTADWRVNNPDTEDASILLKHIQKDKARLLKEKVIKKLNNLPPFEKEDIPCELPNSWIWTRFDEIVINRDGERKPITKSDRVSGKYDYYGASGVIDKVEHYIFDKDLLLIGEDGANLINRSTPIAFFARGKYWVNNHVHVLDASFPEILEYLEIYINSINLEEYITGMAQPKMPQKRMNIIKVPLPPLEEQKTIVQKVNALMGLCDALEQEVQQSQKQSEQLMQSCLREVFEGEKAEVISH